MLHLYLKIAGWSLVLLFSLALIGCKSTSAYYLGWQVENESDAQLSADQQQGHWKTFDLDLNYKYDTAGDVLNISGTIALSFFYEMNTSRIRNLDVYLFFLDNDSKVLETAELSRSVERSQPYRTLEFNKSLQVPTGTSLIAFGYKGAAWEDGGGTPRARGGGGGGRLITFDNLPKRPR